MAGNRPLLISVVFVSLLAWAQAPAAHQPNTSFTPLAQVEESTQPETAAPPPEQAAPSPEQAVPAPEQAQPAPEVATPPPEQAVPSPEQVEPEPDAQIDEEPPPDNAAPPEESTPPSELQNPPQSDAPAPPADPDQSSAPVHDRATAEAAAGQAVIWHMPKDIPSLDLFYGQGGREHLPQPPFTFVKEDQHGSSPKFWARDANRRSWKVKLGQESRPEVVASRLLWAVGYYVNTDYVLPRARVRGLHMKRKSNQQRGTEVLDARFARKPHNEKKVGGWKWSKNPFFGTREFNGLRVMMAVLNNWDLKDDNNAVYQDPRTHQRIYLVSDVGATFGTSGRSWTSSGSKAQPGKYKESKFIIRNTGLEVDFATPASAGPLLAESFGFSAPRFIQYQHQKWIGKNIPTPDAHWIGTLLGQLSHQQLVDAFRAGNFSPREIEEYVPVLQARIAELKAL